MISKFRSWFWYHVWCEIPLWIRSPLWSYQRYLVLKNFSEGDIIEDCRFHVCRIISGPTPDGDIECRSIFDGSPSSCSLFHCGIIHLDADEVTELTRLYKEGGMDSVLATRMLSLDNASNQAGF